MEKRISIAEAKATFCIRQVEMGTPVVITRHGRPVAALVRPADLQNLKRLSKA